ISFPRCSAWERDSPVTLSLLLLLLLLPLLAQILEVDVDDLAEVVFLARARQVLALLGQRDEADAHLVIRSLTELDELGRLVRILGIVFRVVVMRGELQDGSLGER